MSRQEKVPQMTIKSGFYQQYKLDRQVNSNKGLPLPRWNEQTKALLKSILSKISRGLYYIVMLFLCSVGVSALLNAPIREILLTSLFGSGS